MKSVKQSIGQGETGEVLGAILLSRQSMNWRGLGEGGMQCKCPGVEEWGVLPWMWENEEGLWLRS